MRRDNIIKFSENHVRAGVRFQKTILNDVSSSRLAKDIIDYRQMLLSAKNIFRKQITSLIHYIIKHVDANFSDDAKKFWKNEGIEIDRFEYNVEFVDGYKLSCNVFVFINIDGKIVEGFHEHVIKSSLIEYKTWETFLNNVIKPVEKSILVTDEKIPYNVRVNFV